MKFGLTFLFFAAAAFGQPAVSNQHADNIEHSSARIIANFSSLPNGIRVQYAPQPTACSAGITQVSSPSVFLSIAATLNIGGMTPATPYNVCFEGSSDGGMTWGTATPFTVTTLAAPSPDPAPPIAPTAVTNPYYPDTTAYTVVTAASDCSDLQARMNTAGGIQASTGTVIQIPIGTSCAGTYTWPSAPDKKTIASVDADGTFHITAHGYANNTLMRLARNGCLPGSELWPFGLNCFLTGAFKPGYPYFLVNSTANTFQLAATNGGAPLLPGYVNFTVDTGTSSIVIAPVPEAHNGFTWVNNQAMQFTANGGTLPAGLSAGTTYYAKSASCAPANALCEFQVSTSMGGAAVTISSAGSGTFTILTFGSGTQYIRADVKLPEIIIRSSAADNLLPGAHVRICNACGATPSEWAAQMATFRKTTNTGSYGTDMSLVPGVLTTDVRLGPGIEVSQTDTGSTEVLSNNDPTPLFGQVEADMDSQRVVYDRVWIHGIDWPNRVYRPMFNQDGSNIAIINSDLGQWNYFHTAYTGLAPTRSSGTVVTFTAGTASMANNTRPTVTSGGTITFTGGAATSTCYVYITLGQVFTPLCPTGTTMSCSAPGLTCTPATSGSPAFPVNGSGQNTAEPLFTIALAAGAVTSVAAADGFSSHFNTEGTPGLIAGNGPGPILLYNNFISGTGITVHFDDSGGEYLSGQLGRCDYTVQRNVFDQPLRTLFLGASTDGFRYGHRQPLEWKAGCRSLIDGNIFQNNFAEDNPVGTALIDNAFGGSGQVTDMNVTNNTIQNSAGGFEISGAIDSGAGVAPPSLRLAFVNNLILNINAWTQSVAGVSSPGGYCWYGGYGRADLTIRHNTCYNPLGPQIALWHIQQTPEQGVDISNNIFFVDPLNGYVVENVAGCSNGVNGKAALDCSSTPAYNWQKNVLIPTYTSTGPGAPSGAYDPGTMCTAFGGTWSSPNCTGGLAPLVAIGTAVSDRLAYTKFLGNYGLDPSSPFHNAGTDGTDPGVNILALLAAQGAGGASILNGALKLSGAVTIH